MTLTYGFYTSPFGGCLLAVSERGLCHLAFTPQGADAVMSRLANVWPEADLRRDDALIEPFAKAVFTPDGSAAMPLDLRGTPFQRKVWQALLNIPHGEVTTYGDLASAIGQPTAARAVGTAVGDNPVAVLVPCHRVVRRDGSIGGYAYGTDLKSALLRWEGALG
jgi:AraC family transcriptional regulator of adaptative response/methylated-DNA-[protein]-cysteine methyltransferase